MTEKSFHERPLAKPTVANLLPMSPGISLTITFCDAAPTSFCEAPGPTHVLESSVSLCNSVASVDDTHVGTVGFVRIEFIMASAMVSNTALTP